VESCTFDPGARSLVYCTVKHSLSVCSSNTQQFINETVCGYLTTSSQVVVVTVYFYNIGGFTLVLILFYACAALNFSGD